jgi:SAM-dependent methyltransferase
LAKINDTSLVIDTNHPLARYPLQVTALVQQTSTIAAQRGGSLNDIADMITASGPGMQAPVDGMRYFLRGGTVLRREDESDDRLYYHSPRLVHHLDGTARNQVSSCYGRTLENETRVLDLMSSWESHIPDSLESCHVEGLGLNEQELAANQRLSGYLVHDLNEEPVMPIAESSFDAVVCTVSIEYLCRPLEVLSELARILVPGGILALTISERWFPGKQVAQWADLHPFERQGLVLGYLLDQGAFTAIHTESVRGYPRPATDRYSDRMSHSDSLYFIWARCTK